MTKPATTIIDGAAKAIDAIMNSLERDPTDPAVAFRAALRRKGAEITEAGESTTLQNVHKVVCGIGDARNERRATHLNAAWAGLPGWRS